MAKTKKQSDSKLDGISEVNVDDKSDYHTEYLERKKKLRELHKNLKKTKKTQEIYHKIMGTGDSTDEPSEL